VKGENFMAEYSASVIYPYDKRAIKKLDALLNQEGIEHDKNLDYTMGLFDEEGNLVATGSCFGNTLRCLAVDSTHQGEGLMNIVVSNLIEHEYEMGRIDLFLYTKCEMAHRFSSMGFYEIARVNNKVVFMENRKTGFESYLQQLKEETAQNPLSASAKLQGAVIMNANPFTLGHQYLLKTAAKQCELLHVFIVSEDISLVPFLVREKLIREGSAQIQNLVYHTTGNYLISNATFPSYFLKDSDTVILAHAKLDVTIFIRIAQALNISVRFVGEEPFSHVTNLYNQIMKEQLEENGLHCTIIPRLESAGAPVSASSARSALQNGDMELFKSLVPESTWRYFTSAEAKPVLEKIRASKNVIHY
jgi:[citrate (pro-3S)-lyase] ligase